MRRQAGTLVILVVEVVLLQIVFGVAVNLATNEATGWSGVQLRPLLLAVLFGVATIVVRHLRVLSAPQASVDESATAAADAVLLARRVREQWRQELRRTGDERTWLPVAWRSAFPGPEQERTRNRSSVALNRYFQPNAEPALDLRWTDPLAGRDGELPWVLVNRVTSGRLIVLGASGEGKSILLERLTVDLIESRRDAPEAPTPLLLTASSWDPSQQDLWQWIESRVVEDHPFLGAYVRIGDQQRLRRVSLLHRQDLLLPIIDGLDEMDLRLLPEALDKIGTAVGKQEVVVLSCRTEDYLTSLVADRGRKLMDAHEVVLSPLDLAEARAFLIRRAPTRMKSVWTHVFTDMDPGGALAVVLSNALMVALADRIYNADRPPLLVTDGTDERGQPPSVTDLLKIDSQAKIRDVLLTGFLTTVYSSPADGAAEAARRTRHGRKAQWWLANLAGLQAGPGEDSKQGSGRPPPQEPFAWWKLGDRVPGNRIGWVLAIVGGVPTGIVSAINRESGVGLGLGLVIALVIGKQARDVLATRIPGRMTEGSTLGVGAGIAAGLAGGMIGASFREAGPFGGVAGGIGIGFGTGALAGPLPGAIGGFTGALFGQMAAGHGKGIWAGLANGLAAGVALALIARAGQKAPTLRGLGIGWRPSWGLPVGLLSGIVIGLGAEQEFGRATGVTAALLSFAVITVFAGLYRPPPGGDDAVISPLESLRSDRMTFMLFFAVGGAGGTLAIFLGVHPRIAVVAALNGALGLAFFQATWGRYVVARLLFFAEGRLPLRLMGFLAESAERGLMRQVGSRYDFRHPQLRDYLRRAYTWDPQTGLPNRSPESIVLPDRPADVVLPETQTPGPAQTSGPPDEAAGDERS